MMKFGVSGYPPAFYKSDFKKNRVKILQWLHELQLNAFEMQMTYGPKTPIDKCLEYRNLSKELNISISIHAAYYIVLTSPDKVKVKRSLETLMKTFELADILESNIIVLHPGSLYGQPFSESLNRFVENCNNFFNSIGNTNIGLFVETAGKTGQLGSLNEIFKIASNVKGCYPCIDFGHVHAHTLGSLSNSDEIENVFKKIKPYLMLNKDNKIHFHYTPIDYGKKVK